MNAINKHKSRNRISKIICFILKKNCIAFHNPSVEKILNNVLNGSIKPLVNIDKILIVFIPLLLIL